MTPRPRSPLRVPLTRNYWFRMRSRSFVGERLGVSALPPIADMCGATEDVCFGPIADIETMLIISGYDFAYVFLARMSASMVFFRSSIIVFSRR
jgi:hypothetical protein